MRVIEHERSAAAYINAAQIINKRLYRIQFFYNAVYVFSDEFTGVFYGCGNERAVVAFARAKGQTHVQILSALFIKTFLHFENFLHERGVFGRNASIGKQFFKIPAVGNFVVGELSRTYSRQRAPRQRLTFSRRNYFVKSKLAGTLCKTLENELVVRLVFFFEIVKPAGIFNRIKKFPARR